MKSNKYIWFSLFLKSKQNFIFYTQSSIHLVFVLNQNGFLRVRRAGWEQDVPPRGQACAAARLWRPSPALGPWGMAPPGRLQAGPLSHITHSLGVHTGARTWWDKAGAQIQQPAVASRTRGSNFYLGRTKRCRGQIKEKEWVQIKTERASPGGSVVKNSPANAGDSGSIPDLGRSHMPRSNQACAPQLLNLCSRPARHLQSPHTLVAMLCNERGTTTRSHALQLESSFCLPQLQKSPHSNEDPA